MDRVWAGLSGSWRTLADLLSWTSSKIQGVKPEEGIERLRATLERIQAREGALRDEVGACAARVRSFLEQGNRREAMLALKRQKVYDAQLESMQKMGTTVEAQILGLEATLVNADVYSAMKDGASALQTIHRSVGMENVETTLLDLQEHTETADEVAECLAKPMGNAFDTLDETALEEELGLLESEVSGDSGDTPPQAEGSASLDPIPTIEMPEAPTHALEEPHEHLPTSAALSGSEQKKCSMIEKVQ